MTISHIFKISIILVITMISTIVIAASITRMPFNGDYRQSSDFGYRGNICTGCSVYHPAHDYATPVGTPMISTVSGTVTRSVTSNSGYGNFVTVVSNSGNYSVQYSHLSSSGVNVGQSVTTGQQIALSGNSGVGTGAHLDYKISVLDPNTGDMIPVDPALVVGLGLDLDDPNVRAQLIADSEEKLNERRTTNTDGSGDSATNPIPPEDSANFEGLIGCDPAILAGAEAQVKAMNERDMMIAKTMLTKPTDLAVTTCLDQDIEAISNIGGIYANPDGGNISDTVGPLVAQPLSRAIAAMGQNNPLGSLSSMAMNSYAQVTAQFNDALSGLTGGLGAIGGAGAASDCPMNDEIFNLAQCIQMPKIPSLNDLLNGVMGDATGAIADAINSPFEALDNVCQGLSGQMGGYMNDINSVFREASDTITNPIDASARDVRNSGNNAVN